MEGLRQKTSNAVKWQSLKIICSIILNFLFLAVVARFVSKENFGLLAIANASIALITFFSEFGFGAALIQKQQVSTKEITNAFNLTLFTSFVISAIVFFIATPLSIFYENEILKGVIQLLALILIFRGLGIISNSLLIKDLEYKQLFLSDILGLFIGNMVVGCLMAINGFEIWSLVCALLCSAIIASTMKFAFKPIQLKFPRFADWDSNMQFIFKYGLSLTGVRAVHNMALQADKIILGKVLPPGVVGIYDRSNYLSKIPINYYGSATDGVLFSALSRVQSDVQKLKKHFFKFLQISSILFAFVFVSFYVWASEIIHVVLGEKWVDAIPIFRIFALMIPFSLIARFSDTFVRVKNLFHKSIIVKFVYLAAIIVSILILYPVGIKSVSVGILVSVIIHAVLLLGCCLQSLHSNWFEFIWSLVRAAYIIGIILIINLIPYFSLSFFSWPALMKLIIMTGVYLVAFFYLRNHSKNILGDDLYFYLRDNFKHPVMHKLLNIKTT